MYQNQYGISNCISSQFFLLNLVPDADGWGYWLPEGSRHKRVQDWKDRHFAEDTRGTITLFKHEESVLTREGLLLLLDLHERVRAVQNYTDVCLKVPITNIRLADKKRRRRRRQTIDDQIAARPIVEGTLDEGTHVGAILDQKGEISFLLKRYLINATSWIGLHWAIQG